jgi:hypothetical protein
VLSPSIVDAKGDLIVATAADTVARKAVGANDNVLTAASAQADGTTWTKVVDAMVDANAAIARSKLATITRKVFAPIHAATTSGGAWVDGATNETTWDVVVPEDYVSGDITWFVLVRISVTSGTVVFRRDQFRFRDGAVFTNPENAVNWDWTVPGTANQSELRSATLAAANFQVNDVIRLDVTRLGADAGDTAAATAIVDGAWIEYLARP